MITLFRRIRQKLIDSGSITKYLLYAIGEILLVVIGILIALQVNNWNEERKEQTIARDLRTSIINDLNQDIASIDSLKTNIQIEIDAHDSLQAGLINTDITKQEIIGLIKEEFSPFIYTFEGFNDNSYRAAQASGTLNILTESQRTQLNRLYMRQTDIVDTSQDYEQFYLEAINDFNGSYPLQIPFSTFRSGPVYNQKWTDPDFEDLTTLFGKVGTTKRNYYRIIYRALNQVQELSQATIDVLEEEL